MGLPFDQSLIDVNDILPMAVASFIPRQGGVEGGLFVLCINVKKIYF